MTDSAYDTKWLNDIEDFEDYDESARKLLLLLCHRKYNWRTEAGLARGAGLKREDVVRILERLRANAVVSMSLNRKKQVIWGITSRVRG